VKARGLTTAIVEAFLGSRLSVLLIIASTLLGAAALLATPREEEPQIVVPVADVVLSAPGASAEEVETLAAAPLEGRLWEIDGVENVYSMSRAGGALVTVRFYVGEDRERSLVKVWNKVMSTRDALPPIVAGWSVAPVEIDDVPIVLATLWSPSDAYDGAALRRIADEVLPHIRGVAEAGRAWVQGGLRRRVHVRLAPAALAARGLAPLDVGRAIGAANASVRAGLFERGGREAVLESGPFVASAEELAGLVVGVHGGRPVHLRDVAEVSDAPEEPETYARIGFGPAHARARTIGGAAALESARAAPRPGDERPAVTIAVAKRKGANAVRVARDVVAAIDGLRGRAIPPEVVATVTRDMGETADHKVNELVKHLVVAIATIIVLLAFALGPKEALIVAVAVPVTLALTLFLDLLFGYTINRVTLFALILSLGLLVDDPIVDVENIFRHFQMRRETPFEATLTAVDEVRPPTILATFTVIVSFIPLFFITGMMGPYMAPMAFNVPVAMLLSLVVAFTITPWATYHVLKGDHAKGAEGDGEHGHGHGHGHDPESAGIRETRAYRAYRRILAPLLAGRGRAALFLLAVLLAFVGSAALAATGRVPLKMLPFDDKNELLLVLDTPEGTTLEETDALARDLGRALAATAEVTDYESFVGEASPIDFNGLVRHSYAKRGSNVAEVRVNLLPKEERAMQSHALALRVRPEIERIARRLPGASVKVVESPPGPPVMATLVAEVSGPPGAPYADLVAAARDVRADFEAVKGVADVDDTVEAPRPRARFLVDREKAALHGVAPSEVAETLALVLGGAPAGVLHLEGERLPLEAVVRLPRALRSAPQDLLSLRVRGAGGALVPLSELGRVEEDADPPAITRKDLRRTVFVTAEVVGRSPVEAVLDLGARRAARPLPPGYRAEMAGEGEWKITVDVFRDLGLAFAAALAMIYVLLVAQTGSLAVPLVIMVAIPLTVIGIMPGFWALNALFARPVGEIANPVYFTATGMIGMIALAGIVVRNSIILIDFIERVRARDPGAPLAEAVIEAGAVRIRPILLTAGAAMFGSFVITLDPIFSGLAWSFIFGIFASTAFSLLVVPVIYALANRGGANGGAA
jgi:multidrug efflux pump subunit AcrB